MQDFFYYGKVLFDVDFRIFMSEKSKDIQTLNFEGSLQCSIDQAKLSQLQSYVIVQSISWCYPIGVNKMLWRFIFQYNHFLEIMKLIMEMDWK